MNTRQKVITAILVPLGIVALLCAGRWLWFYRGWYRAPQIPEIDESSLIPAPAWYQPFVEEPTAGNGRVVIDMAHANHLAINDLSPLLDRLAVRGVEIQALDSINPSLAGHLHGATAFLVIAPTSRFTSEEQDAVVDFVADGGRLLLVADPTRPVQEKSEDEDEWPSLYDIFFPTSAVPAINSLANRFGIVYFDDYLYNLEDNAGNYRNVKFTTFAREHPLTRDIETVVFFASHSLLSDGIALVIGDRQTRSSVRSGETGLAAATLNAEGQVLALGDLTFLTPPYHTIGDNDRFLSHIADWLAVDSRKRDALDDFPYFFTRPVDLVQVSGDFLAPQLIAFSGQLREFFQQAGYTITMRAEVTPGHDVLLLGLFEDTKAVQDYLISAGVTITVPVKEDEGDSNLSEETEGEQEGGQEETEETEGEQEGGQEETEETEGEQEGGREETEETSPGLISIEALGDIGVEGTTLYLLDRAGAPGAERATLIVLAEDYEALVTAVERLSSRDLAGCVQAGMVTLCSTGAAQEGLGEEREEEPSDEGKSGGRVFILADDGRPEGERVSAAEFEAILSASYDVTVWSIAGDGMPTSDDLAGYGVYIVDSGDYAFDIEHAGALSILELIESGGVMLIGDQPMPSLDNDLQPIRDLQVADASHPLAAGFDAGEVITLLASESGVPALVLDEDDFTDDTKVVFRRGPESPNSGAPAVIAVIAEEENNIKRAVMVAFAFYRLPEAAQRTFALNVVRWLMEADAE